MGVPFELPSHLRQCAEEYGVTVPETLQTRADLLAAYGQERKANLTKSECIREIARLVDKHNENMRNLKKE